MSELEQTSHLLREIFLWGFMSGLPPANAAWSLTRLASTMTDLRLRAGETLYRAGDASADHFFIQEGEVKLHADDAPVWTFGARSLIGTMDLMIGRPRSRSAIISADAHLWRIPGRDWLDLLEANFELTRSSLHGLSTGIDALQIAVGGIDDLEERGPVEEPGVVAGPGLGLVHRVLTLRALPLFREADAQALVDLASIAEEVTVADGESIITRGEQSPWLFVVTAGEVVGRRAEHGPRERYGTGQVVFGAAAVSADAGTHDAQAVGETRLLRFGREDYLDLVEDHFTLARAAIKALALERERLINARERRQGLSPARPQRP